MSQYAWILDGMPVGVWVGSVPNGEAAYVNAAFSEIMGMGAVEGADIEAAPDAYGIFTLGGDHYPVSKLPFSQVVASGKSVSVDDIVIRRRDGTAVNVRAFGHPVRDAGGHLTHVIVAFTDITKEVRAERDRQTVEARLTLAVDHAPIVIWTADTQGVVGLSAGAGLKALGVKSGELVGKSVFDLYADHPTIPGFLRRALAGESLSYTVELGPVIFDTYVTPLRDERGNVMGVTALSHDVTEIRKLQAAAIQSDRAVAMGTLAASVAHEINNPLTYVLSHLNNAKEQLEKLQATLGSSSMPEEIAVALKACETSLSTAEQGAERMATITRELRTFSHPDGGDPALVDMRRVVDSVLRLVRKEVEADASLGLRLEPVPAVLGNEPRLVQVTLNLLMNARQAVENQEDRRILIATRTSQGQVFLEIADSGRGIPDSDRERVFDPFVTTKAIGEGSGLGLFVCRNIVRSLGGQITVARSELGGALFTVSLPGAGAVVSEAPRSSSNPRQSGAISARILIVDDETLVAEVLEQQLKLAGFDASSVHDGSEALRLLLSDARFDLVFCDLMMAGMTGMALAAELERKAPEQARKVVYMTGGAFTPQARAFLALHQHNHIDKPFDIVKEAQRRLSQLR
jgi:PAS domain S-box-containing protein